MSFSELSATTFQQTLINELDQLSGIILELYKNKASWDVRHKTDHSPLTLADLTAHDFLNQLLGKLLPGVPIISEEGIDIPLTRRQNWSSYWMIDPLDGTSEFIHQTGEFAINVSFIHAGTPILGLLAIPTQQKIYFGLQGQGVHCIESGRLNVHDWRRLLHTTNAIPKTLNIACSRRNQTASFARFRDDLCKTEALIRKTSYKTLGSALKFCEMLEGRAHLYPRFSPVCEWDASAGHALLNAMGGGIKDHTGNALSYNEREYFNEIYFIAAANQKLMEASFPHWEAQIKQLHQSPKS